MTKMIQANNKQSITGNDNNHTHYRQHHIIGIGSTTAAAKWTTTTNRIVHLAVLRMTIV
jgi:hypothetical protein